ncbi:nitronate monooxygenase, partial [Pseudomonas syringae pv. tagetis]
YSGRVIGNEFSDSWVGKEQAFAASAGKLRLDYEAAMAADDESIRAIWAGEVADLIKDVMHAQLIVE